MPELKWVKVPVVRKDELEAVKTVVGGLEYRIYQQPKSGKWVLVYGKKDSREFLFKGETKAACKKHIQSVLNNPKLEKEEVQATYKDKVRKDGFVYRTFSDRPEVKPYKVGKASPLFPDEDESVRYWRMIWKLADDVNATLLFYPPSTASTTKPEEVIEDYPGEVKPLRVRKGRVVVAPSGECPVKLDDSKWKTLRKWGEAVFKEYESFGAHLTVQGLIAFARVELPDEVAKVTRRLKSIFMLDYQQEVGILRGMMVSKQVPEVVQEEERPTVPELAPRPAKKEYDKFGYRLGTRAAKINAVLDATPRTELEIRKLIGHHANVGGHLADLVDRGVAKKVEGNKYRLLKKKSK